MAPTMPWYCRFSRNPRCDGPALERLPLKWIPVQRQQTRRHDDIARLPLKWIPVRRQQASKWMAGAAALLCAAMMSACQTADGPGGGLGEDTGRSAQFRDRRGWNVAYVAPENRTPAHCRGRRDPKPSGLRITFFGGELESGFRLEGIPTDHRLAAGEELVASFDGGDRRSFTPNSRDGQSLTVTFPTRRYEDVLYPFAHSRQVEFRGRRGGLLGEIALDGSSWTINATDECRRMKVPPIG